MVVNGNTSRLAPTIRPFVEELFSSELFSQHDLELIAPHSGLILYDIHSNSSEDVCDRFKLVLPCAGYPIVWEVIFDGTCSSAAPDFIFDDESFLCDCDLDSIPSLVNWDPSEIKSFVHVISDLLKLYSKHQWQEAERNINPCIAKWLDFETVENEGLNVEVLYGSHLRSPPSTMSRQNILQSGYTSVLVKVPVSCELIDCKDMQFSVQYIFKSHVQTYEERIQCSPELEEWLGPYSENLEKRTRNCKALSAAVQSHMKDITELFRKIVQDYKQRQNLQLSLLHNVMSKEEANPSVLEFDFNNFLFSSFLLGGNKLFSVDFFRGSLRGRLFEIADDCYRKFITEYKASTLNDPNFDIMNALS